MRYFLLLLLLVGCADQQVKTSEIDPAVKLAKEEADHKRCDYMVGGPRDSDAYLKCLSYD